MPRILWSVSVSRYLLTFLAVCIVLSLAWCRKDRPLSQTYRRILLVYPLAYGVFFVRWGWAGWEHRELMITAVVLLVVVTLAHKSFERSVRFGAGITFALIALTCSFLQIRRDVNWGPAFAESFALHPSPRHWAGAAALVNDPLAEHHLALTGGPSQPAHDWFFYPFFGARLQNHISYVPVTQDGSISHLGPFGDLDRRADKQRWLERLAERGITEVISFFPRSIEQQWMDETPQLFQKLVGDVNWGLYRRIE